MTTENYKVTHIVELLCSFYGVYLRGQPCLRAGVVAGCVRARRVVTYFGRFFRENRVSVTLKDILQGDSMR